MRVVIEENVLIFALGAEAGDPTGLECARLIEVLRERCQHQLVRTPSLFGRYSRQAQSASVTTLGVALRRRFFDLINDAAKVVMLDEPAEAQSPCDFSGVKDDDLLLAGAAWSAGPGAILVTEDLPLRIAVAAASCGVEAASVTDTIASLRAP